MNTKFLLLFFVLVSFTMTAQDTSSDESNDSPLIVGFTGKQIENSVKFSWQLAKKVDVLMLERSNDGKSFELLEVIYTKDHEIYEGVYHALDATPQSGNNTYRLKYSLRELPDVYSNTIPIFYCNETKDVSIRPSSPLKQALVQIRNAGKLDVAVLDEMGTTLQGYQLSLPSNAAHMIDLKQFTEGKYYVQVIMNGHKFLQRIVLQ